MIRMLLLVIDFKPGAFHLKCRMACDSMDSRSVRICVNVDDKEMYSFSWVGLKNLKIQSVLTVMKGTF
jgi:hypothetical protein